MKDWLKKKGNRVLLTLAALSLVVTIAEGLLYYADYENLFFRLLLTLQNSIKVFTFKSPISLEDALSFIIAEPTVLRETVGYSYMAAVFIAPYCTIAALYRVLERAFRFVFWLKQNRNQERIIIFGYNDTVRHLLKSEVGQKDRRIHVVCASEVSSDEQYKMLKKNIRPHHFNFLQADGNEHRKLLKELEIQKAGHVFLLEDSSVSNFSLLQAISDKSEGKLPKGFTVHCRCDDYGIYQVIEGFYEADQGRRHEQYDLEVFNLPDIQVREMFRQYPLHSCWYDKKGGQTVKPAEWGVHLLILGFGMLGQQVLLQAMNLSVVHSENPVLIEVIDNQGPEKWSVFLNRISSDALIQKDAENEFRVREDWADGQLTIRFHQLDVRYDSFRRELQQLMTGDAGLFTYVVAAMDMPDVGLYCASMVHRLLCSVDRERGEKVPILLRMDHNLQLRDYVGTENGNPRLQGIHLIPDVESISKIEHLLAKNINDAAKQYNAYYHHMFEGGAAPDPADSDAAWRGLSLSLRNDNRAAAQHLPVLRDALDAECGDGLRERLAALFTGSKAILSYAGGRWDAPPPGSEFLRRVMALEDPLGREMLKTEHRRWCYQRIADGWAQSKSVGGEKPKKDILLSQNPCLVPWEELQKVDINYYIYDLMPLMIEFEDGLK